MVARCNRVRQPCSHLNVDDQAFLFILSGLRADEDYFPLFNNYLLFINKYLSIFAF